MTTGAPVNAAGGASERMWRMWWRRLWGINGLVSLAAGVIVLIWPDESLIVLSVVLGLWLVVAALIQVGQAAVAPGGRTVVAPGGRTAQERLLAAGGGLIYLAGGVFCLIHPFDTVAVLASIFGVVLILGGLIELFSGTRRKSGRRRIPQIGVGVIAVLAGLVVLIWPSWTLVTLIRIAGIALLALGLAQVYAAHRARQRAGETP